MQDDGGRHFEGEVAEEEDSRAQTEHLQGEAYIFVHGESGEADVDAIEKGYKV